MAPSLLSLHLLLALFTVISVNIAQAGPDVSHNRFARNKASSDRVLIPRAGDGGVGK